MSQINPPFSSINRFKNRCSNPWNNTNYTGKITRKYMTIWEQFCICRHVENWQGDKKASLKLLTWLLKKMHQKYHSLNSEGCYCNLWIIKTENIKLWKALCKVSLKLCAYSPIWYDQYQIENQCPAVVCWPLTATGITVLIQCFFQTPPIWPTYLLPNSKYQIHPHFH